MNLTPRIEAAIRAASLLHDGQKRKAERDLPYVSHLFSVAALLSSYAKDEDVVIGGLLHDSLEDTGYTREALEADFGPRVARMVSEVTEEKERDGSPVAWKDRKRAYVAALEEASAEALMIAAADKIHNLSTTLSDFEMHGEGIWKNFRVPIEEQMWFYREVLDVLERRLESPIVTEYHNVVKRAKEVFNC
ncbi:MAG TPA: HD domain-containing protein [Candidatus Paceibacterota bacterium]|nr:HD domain-containing protein [Candidatus Paceibacterota bacterium]